MVQFGYESFDWHRYLVMLAEPVDPVRGQRVTIDIVHFQFSAIALSPVVPLMLSVGVQCIFSVIFQKAKTKKRISNYVPRLKTYR